MDFINDNNLESSLSNINLDFSNINIKKTYIIPLSGKWSSIKMSKDGKYQIACQTLENGQLFISNNYGLNWTCVDFLTQNDFIGFFSSVGISADGKYQSAVQNGKCVYVSQNYGVTWTIIQNVLYKSETGNIIYNMIKNWVSIDISGNGKYQTAINLDNGISDDGYTPIPGNIFRSSDYGTSWVDVTPNIPDLYYFFLVSISYSGKYQVVTHSLGILLSNDYGLTWTNNTDYSYGLLSILNSSKDDTIDGKYIYSYESDGGYGIYKSNNYGETFEFSSFPNEDEDKYTTIYSIITSSSAEYVYCLSRKSSNKETGIYISIDYGKTWKWLILTEFKLYDFFIKFNMCGSENLSYISIINDIDKIYLSNNYGETFNDNNDSPFYNFIYKIKTSSSGQYQLSFINNDNIILSKNYGEIWNKIDLIKSWYSTTISLTGQYQACIDEDGLIYISDNYGETWKFIKILGPKCIIQMSGDGKYYTAMETNSSYLYISNDYGNTWELIEHGFFNRNIGMSLNGKYQTLLIALDINISNDYGKTWFSTNIKLIDFDVFWTFISVSSNGKFQLICDSSSESRPYYAISNDYGQNWIVYRLEYNNILKNNNCVVSSTGQYQFISTTMTDFKINIFYSIDYGNTWNLLDTSSIDYNSNISSVSSSGQYLVLNNQNSICEIYLNSIKN